MQQSLCAETLLTVFKSLLNCTSKISLLCNAIVESSRDTVQRRKNSCLRDAFVFFLLADVKTSADRSEIVPGRLFHTCGPAAVKLLSPNVLRVHLCGTTHVPSVAGRRKRRLNCCNCISHLRKLRRSK